MGPLTFLPLAIELIQGSKAKQAHDQYAARLERMNKEIPEAVQQADELYEVMAQEGLPGKEIIQESISDQIASAYGKAGEQLGAYPDLFTYLTNLQTNEARTMRDLEVEDARAKLANMQQYAQFLSTIKGGYEADVEQFNLDKILAAERERMAGTAEFMEAANRGIGGSIAMYGQEQTSDYMKQKLENEKAMWSVFANNAAATPPATTPPNPGGVVPTPPPATPPAGWNGVPYAVPQQPPAATPGATTNTQNIPFGMNMGMDMMKNWMDYGLFDPANYWKFGQFGTGNF